MLEKKLIRALLCFVVALSFSATGAMGDNILFISAMNPDQTIVDDALKAFMEGLGHTVTYFDDDEDEAATEAAAAAADLVYISESVGSSEIREEITEIETPMIVGEPWGWDEMGLTEGGGGDENTVTADVEIVNPGHFLAAGLSGTVAVLTDITGVLGDCHLGKGIAGEEATVIATATLEDGQTYDIIFVYEKGTALPVAPTDGSPQFAADIRIGFGFHEWCDPLLNENAYALLEAAIKYILGVKPKARTPKPRNGALYEDIWATLEWSPGDFAVSHDVYFGDNFDDVNDGTGDTFQGNQVSTLLIVGFPGFAFPDGLVPGTTYYWRVDEINDQDPNSPWKGDVWNFWIPPKKAYEPNPADGTKFVVQDTELNWTAGFGTKLHYVYFGDNFDDVNNATVGIPSAFNAYTPSALELEKTYYWRIDEFDGVATHKGDVWSFSTIPNIAITDPSLVGWWKLDEDMGTTAVDWSGHGNHGTFEGDPQWVPGYDGAALEFDGSDYVDTGYTEDLANWTVTAWVISPAAPSGRTNTGPVHREKNYQFNWDHSDATVRGAAAMSVGGTWYAASYQPLEANIWYHLAATYDGNSFNAYRDGVLITSNSAPSGPPDTESGTLKLGRHSTAAQYFIGTVDNVRVYNKALTVEEIQLAMRGDLLVAWGPNPTNGSTPYIRDATPLNWSAGDNASGHDVYFGIDKDAVADADESDTTGIYRGRQGVTIYTPPEVEWGGGPYYWRVDEYNTDATISKGNVWKFTVADFIGIDDIEDYNDYPPDEIFSTWIDGWEVPTNGSLAGHADPPFAETGNVHGGRQSMPVYYENNFKYSEVTMTLVSVRDWTEEGVGVLSLWFYGDTSNAAERMYVNLNGIATVYHDNPDAALIDTWTEWTIDLQEFAAQGVNLANVTTISIGFGDKSNLQAGGSGMVLFDDIRLYRPPAP